MLGGSSNSSAYSEFLSQVKQANLRSSNPIEISETEKLTVLGQRVIWLNRAEVNAWTGDISINEYRTHEDSNPQVINKKIPTTS